MTDRELLELAAKAYVAKSWRDNEAYMRVFMESWHPLENDCQAFRLAVELNMLLDCCGMMARTTDDSIPWQEATGCADANQAMRRAIVMCAAEIGRAMP